MRIRNRTGGVFRFYIIAAVTAGTEITQTTIALILMMIIWMKTSATSTEITMAVMFEREIPIPKFGSTSIWT